MYSNLFTLLPSIFFGHNSSASEARSFEARSFEARFSEARSFEARSSAEAHLKYTTVRPYL